VCKKVVPKKGVRIGPVGRTKSSWERKARWSVGLAEGKKPPEKGKQETARARPLRIPREKKVRVNERVEKTGLGHGGKGGRLTKKEKRMKTPSGGKGGKKK